jgi:phenylpropionate dioxygenase-like ring-hydroxylating dioxygenase large terminal subunit
MKHVSQPSWFSVCQESEIPHPGDFKVFAFAQRSFIVVRDDEGQVRVLFNICRHRHVTVCRQARGNTVSFICPDHGWVYNTKGDLIGLRGPNDSLRQFSQRRGLTPAPRMQLHKGIIFASLSPNGESLEEYLQTSQKMKGPVVE